MGQELAKPELYICGVDICKQGFQFCYRLQRRCVWCADAQVDCFTQHQQQNCTLFCMNKWRDEQQACTCKHGNECDVWTAPTYIFLATSVICFISLIGIIVYTNEQTISSIKTRALDFGAESIIRIRVCCGFCMNGSGHGRHTQLCPCVERLPEIDAEERHPSDNPTFVPSVATLEDPPDPQRGPNNDTLGSAHEVQKYNVRRELPSNYSEASGQMYGLVLDLNSLKEK